MKLICIEKFLALQSLGNQIIVYSVGDKIRASNRKCFRGHVVAGYSIRPAFSPDGKFMTSGDGSGNVWFWDWKTNRVSKKFKAHESVVTASEWHPHETSKVVTCSWDSTIKYVLYI